MRTLGDKIRLIRQLRGITQVKLAEMTGIHPVSIRKYETNKMQPLVPQVEKIAEALQVSANAILGSTMTTRPISTIGDLMGLVIDGHKAGVITMQGPRNADGKLDAQAMLIVPNPVFEHFLYLGIIKPNEGGTLLSWKGLTAVPQNTGVLYSLLEWEEQYNCVTECHARMSRAEPETDAYYRIAQDLEEAIESMELTELQIRAADLPISECKSDMTFDHFIQPLDRLQRLKATREAATKRSDEEDDT